MNIFLANCISFAFEVDAVDEEDEWITIFIFLRGVTRWPSLWYLLSATESFNCSSCYCWRMPYVYFSFFFQKVNDPCHAHEFLLVPSYHYWSWYADTEKTQKTRPGYIPGVGI